MRKSVTALVTAALVITGAVAASATSSQAGTGAPSGPHYNLNIIGVPKGKTASMTGSNTRTIFVSATASNPKIYLCQSGTANCAPGGGFQVLDGNATDANGGTFALPSPDPIPGDGITGCPIGDTCTTSYSVYMRVLGKPGGSIHLKSCFTDTTGTYCSVGEGNVVTQVRSTGKSTFTNVSKQLLTVCWDSDLNGTCDTRDYLFGRTGASYWWDYVVNSDFKLAQLRFYPIATSFTS
ncbi:MAG: hypothetical protein ACO3C1_04115 [Ilumatobacteraceae bacterium]